MRVPARTALVSVAWFALARAAAAEELSIPAELQPALSQVVEAGVLLHRLDVAGARATDEMAAHKFLKRDKRVRGWLTAAPATAGEPIQVTFVGEVAGTPLALYRVRVPDAGKAAIERLDTPAPLAEGEAAQWRARQLALQALVSRQDTCAERYNPVVFARATPDGERIQVYLLAATTEPRTVVAGGHFRYEYSADGRTELSQRPFTRACMTLVADKGSGTPVSLMLTHLLDPTPTEIHVFLGLLHGHRVAVGTEKHLWSVEGTRISLISQRD